MSFMDSLKSFLGFTPKEVVEQAPVTVAEAPVAPTPAPEATQAVETLMNDPMVAPHVEAVPVETAAPVIDTAIDSTIEVGAPAENQ